MDASKMNFDRHGPVFYGKIDMLEKLTIGMMLTRMLKGELSAAPPNFLLNLALLLVLAALERMGTDAPDAVMADFSDCAVRSLSNMRAWKRECEE